MQQPLEQESVDEASLQKDSADDFVSGTILASFQNGTVHQSVNVFLHKDTGLGYRELRDGTCALLLKDGYLLCRYILPTHWQAQEACQRLACLVNFQVSASQLFSTYAQTHGGEKLGDVIRRIFIEVMELSSLPQPAYSSIEEHLEALKDFVLERGDPEMPIPPIM